MATRTELDVNTIATLSSTFAVRNILNKILDSYQDSMNYFDMLELTGAAVSSPTAEFTNFTEDTVQRAAITSGTTTAGTGGANVTVTFDAAGAVPIKNETILFPNGVTALVWSITGLAAVLKPLGTSNNIPATTNAMQLVILSNAVEEGGKANDTVRRPSNVLRSNYIQTFATRDEITNIAGATEVEIPYDGSTYILKKQKAQHLLIHKMQVFNQMLFGEKDKIVGQNGKTTYFTDGVRTQITKRGGFNLQTLTTDVFDIIADAKALAVAYDAARGPSEYNALCGQTAHLAIDSNSAANASFNGGGISYASYGSGGKEIALAIGVKSMSFGNYTTHFQRFKALEHKGLTGATGYGAYKKEIYLMPSGKTKVKGGMEQDRTRIRYMNFNGDKSLRYLDYEGGLLSPGKNTSDLIYENALYSQQAIEMCGIEQFGIMTIK